MPENPYDIDWADHATLLVQAARDEEQWYASLARRLLRPGDRRAVDIGCGGGGMTLALATALGPAGMVVAVDHEPAVLEALRQRLAELPRPGAGAAPDTAPDTAPDAAPDAATGPDPAARRHPAPGTGELGRVELVAADLGSGLAPVAEALAGDDSGGADLVWAADSVHHVGDQQRAIDTLAGLLAPGGQLALAEGGLSARRLPWDLGVGEPGLEDRLNAANDRWFARMRAQLPDNVRMPYGWSEALRRAGLTGVTTRSEVLEQPAPLPEPDRHRLAERLTRWVDRLRQAELLEPADLAAWDRLLDPDDPAWLGHRKDVFLLRTRSVYLGTRPATPPAPDGV